MERHGNTDCKANFKHIGDWTALTTNVKIDIGGGIKTANNLISDHISAPEDSEGANSGGPA
jgi:hypothetical protein